MAYVLCVSHEWNLGFEELRELADAGFCVIPVPDGAEAIKHFEAREIDAIVINSRLPDIAVSELVLYFRQQDEGIPIVMLSTVMPVKFVPAGVEAVLQKHGCAALLVSTLEVMLAARAGKPAASEGGDTLARAA